MSEREQRRPAEAAMRFGDEPQLPGEPLSRDGEPRHLAPERGEQWVRGLAGEGTLSDADNEALIALCLGEEFCNLSGRERACAAELAERLDAPVGSARRGAVAGEAGSSERAEDDVERLVQVAEAVRAAAAAGTIDELTNERLVQAAVGQFVPARRGRLRWLSAGGLAAAAAVALWWAAGPAQQADGHRPALAGAGAAAAVHRAEAALIPARSTQPLFDSATRFPVRGGESERLDRIAAARATDLRANQYAMWGVP